MQEINDSQIKCRKIDMQSHDTGVPESTGMEIVGIAELFVLFILWVGWRGGG
jgi:hypothetical protein